MVNAKSKTYRRVTQKYKNTITIRDGIKFRSKKEADYFSMLQTARKTGYIDFFIRQPMFDLPGGVTYKADFLVFYSDGTIQIIDVKGHRTKDFIQKKKMVEALYSIVISEK